MTDDLYQVSISVGCQEGDEWYFAKLHNALNVPFVDPSDRFQKLRDEGFKAPRQWLLDPRLDVDYEFLHPLEERDA